MKPYGRSISESISGSERKRTPVRMKQTLQLKLSQHLTLTPQLQQSIRLLQLSTVELNAEVERMLQENPLLEKAEGDEEPRPRRSQLGDAPPPRRPRRRAARDDEPRRDQDADDECARARRTPSTAPTSRTIRGGDSDWGGGSGATTTTTASTRSRSRRARCATTCCRQLAVLNLPLRDRQLVARADRRARRGRLPARRRSRRSAELFPEELEIDPDELSIALRYLQSFEPAGVGARDAAECLALQLKALPETTPLPRRGAQGRHRAPAAARGARLHAS